MVTQDLFVGSGPVVVASTLICFVNILLHSVGSYLLVSVYKAGSRTVQMVFLINMSIADIFMSAMLISEDILSIVRGEDDHAKMSNGMVEWIYIALYGSRYR